VEAGQNIITLGPAGITIQAKAGKMSIESSAPMTVRSSAAMTIQASAAVNLTAGAALNVNAALANFTGAIKCSAIIAQAVVGLIYSPSRGTILP
jgi:hypothetical protein